MEAIAREGAEKVVPLSEIPKSLIEFALSPSPASK